MGKLNPQPRLGEKKPDQETAAKFLPQKLTLNSLREAAAGCTACHLYLRGTQTVFGEGSRHAEVVLVGEQPGNDEDLTGKPFVGPAGKLLDRALEAAGVDRTQTYVTNIVKHFKWEPRGKRRIHKKPNAMEIAACRPWFDAEVRVLKPQVVVALGATAAQALLGKNFKVTQRRGEIIRDSGLAPAVVATVHPSSILRAPDDDTRHEEMRKFIDDMRQVAKAIADSKRNKAA
jgi:uracil-DNA glycosylase family protein